MATKSDATATAAATQEAVAPARTDKARAKALQAANLGTGKTGFEAVTLYNRAGDERVVETVAAKVQAEFEGWSATKPSK